MELVAMAYHNRGRGDSSKPNLGDDISWQWVKKNTEDINNSIF
jgi:hypothetical protein